MNQPDRFIPHLDDMLKRPEAAAWLQVTQRWLAQDGTQHKPQIPVFRPGPFTIRYHPRTIIAKLAREAGVPEETIAASFGLHVNNIDP